MGGKNYLSELRKKYQRNFDIEENTLLTNMPVDLFAKSHVRNESYFGSKGITIYAFENNEYCYAKYQDEILIQDIEQFAENLKEEIDKKVIVHEEHMSSTFTGILITNKILHPEIIRYITQYSYQKSYWFGLKGWSDVRFILVELDTGQVYTVARQKMLKSYIDQRD